MPSPDKLLLRRPPAARLTYHPGPLARMWARACPELKLPWKLVSPLINRRATRPANGWGWGQVLKAPKGPRPPCLFPKNVPLYPEQGGAQRAAGREKALTFCWLGSAGRNLTFTLK
jgi:hypothetical protein